MKTIAIPALLACFAVAHAQPLDPQEPPDGFLRSAEREVPVWIDPRVVAIRFSGDIDSAEVRSFFDQRRDFGLEDVSSEELWDQGIAIFELAPGQSVEAVRDTLRENPLVSATGAVLFLRTGAGSLVMTDRLVVGLAAGADLRNLRGLVTDDGRDVLDGVSVDESAQPSPDRVVLIVDSGSTRNALQVADDIYRANQELAEISPPVVEYVEPELFVEMQLRESPDPKLTDQWHLHNEGGLYGKVADADVDGPEAWNYTRGSPEIIIAVLDDGIETNHPDLKDNMSDAGRDFTEDPPGMDANPKKKGDRHGTSVAGIAAARGNNGIGVSGICPLCTILPLRIKGTSNINTADAFDYAVEQGAHVITNSWGYSLAGAGLFGQDDVVTAINNAATGGRNGLGTVILFAMPNESGDWCTPENADIASLDSVIAVGASNHKDEIGGAGSGDCLDLVGPTKPELSATIGITTTDRSGNAGHVRGDYFMFFGGTSAATPLVAGIAGLLLSMNEDLRREDVQQILEHTADKIDPSAAQYDDVGYSDSAGYGRANADRSVVPTVTIEVVPKQITVNQAFSVIVRASAPYGLKTVSWSGQNTGIPELDQEHPVTVTQDPNYVYKHTWSVEGVPAAQTIVLKADAWDIRFETRQAIADYPHQASSGPGSAAIEIEILPIN